MKGVRATVTPVADHSITLARLPEVGIDAVTALLSEPRNARHMPLAREPFTTEAATQWVTDKDWQWQQNGFGPWAILVDDEFAGWGGFQAERDGADFALVLDPRYWGQGQAIARIALNYGFSLFGFDSVTIALPYSRTPGRVVARWGFRPDGEISHGGSRFRQYRLDRKAWAQRRSRRDEPA